MSAPTLSSTFLLPPKPIAQKYPNDTPYHKIYNIDPETYQEEAGEVHDETMKYLFNKLEEVPSMYTLVYHTLELLGADKTLENYVKLLTAFEIATVLSASDIIKETKMKILREVRNLVDNALQGDSS